MSKTAKMSKIHLNRMHIITLVAVRLQSHRLKHKAVLHLQGKTVLWHLMGRVKRAHYPQKTVICTSRDKTDDALEAFAREHKYPIFRGEPDDVLLRFIEASEQYRADHIVRITGDNPLTDPMLIDEMIKKHVEENAEYTYTEDTPRGTRPEIISVRALHKCYRLRSDPKTSQYMTFYFKNNPSVYRLARYDWPFRQYTRPNYLVTIDTRADYDVVQKIYEALYPDNSRFSLTDVVRFLDQHPDITHSDRRKKRVDFTNVNIKMNKRRVNIKDSRI